MDSKHRLRVMISSRTRTEVLDPPQPLKPVREALRDFIQDEVTFHGEQVFDVWICEDDKGHGVEDWWETSKREVRDADIILVLYTGEAGSQLRDEGHGICHAEFFEAMRFVREKVATPIDLSATLAATPDLPRDRAFQTHMNEIKRWPGDVSTMDDLKDACATALVERVFQNAGLAVRRRLSAALDRGNALEWAKLDFAARKQKIESTLANYIIHERGGVDEPAAPINAPVIVSKTDDEKVCWVISGIPGALSIGAAREMAGLPFLHDHEVAATLDDDVHGPVHIIGCHKNITETQALKIIGVPDCTLVKTDFGVYLADNVRKIQILFLAKCCDVTSTQAAIQTMFHWLKGVEELDDVVARARSRRRIADVIAAEMG